MLYFKGELHSSPLAGTPAPKPEQMEGLEGRKPPEITLTLFWTQVMASLWKVLKPLVHAVPWMLLKADVGAVAGRK